MKTILKLTWEFLKKFGVFIVLFIGIPLYKAWVSRKKELAENAEGRERARRNAEVKNHEDNIRASKRRLSRIKKWITSGCIFICFIFIFDNSYCLAGMDCYQTNIILRAALDECDYQNSELQMNNDLLKSNNISLDKENAVLKVKAEQKSWFVKLYEFLDAPVAFVLGILLANQVRKSK